MAMDEPVQGHWPDVQPLPAGLTSQMTDPQLTGALV